MYLPCKTFYWFQIGWIALVYAVKIFFVLQKVLNNICCVSVTVNHFCGILFEYSKIFNFLLKLSKILLFRNMYIRFNALFLRCGKTVLLSNLFYKEACYKNELIGYSAF